MVYNDNGFYQRLLDSLRDVENRALMIVTKTGAVSQIKYDQRKKSNEGPKYTSLQSEESESRSAQDTR
jgi:hypothetical protein